jgi:hypothetical protein
MVHYVQQEVGLFLRYIEGMKIMGIERNTGVRQHCVYCVSYFIV